VAIAVTVRAGLLLFLRLGRSRGLGWSGWSGWLEIRVRDCQVVDCFYVRGCGPQVLDAGCEAFCSGEQEVLGEGLLCFGGMRGGEEALLGG
jgi:hypothetical protein